MAILGYNYTYTSGTGGTVSVNSTQIYDPTQNYALRFTNNDGSHYSINGLVTTTNYNFGYGYYDNAATTTFQFLEYATTAATAKANFIWNGQWTGLAIEPIISIAEQIKKAIRTRIAPVIFTHAKPLGFTKDLREIRARETLQRVIGEERYRSFLKKGFISVRAKSGLFYQIYPGHDFTKVYDNGKMIDRYCVVMNGGFPPTDSLIMRYLLILNNEEMFKSYAVKHGTGFILPYETQVNKDKSLFEVFRELKRAA